MGFGTKPACSWESREAKLVARLSEGAMFENAIFNQLRPSGDLTCLTKGNDYEIDFILRPAGAGEQAPLALEAKINPLPADLQKVRRVAAAHALPAAHVIGRFPTPGFNEFVWGGLIF
jgi:hypothetical protein